VIIAQLMLGLAALAICGALLKRFRTETFPHGKDFLRVLLGCCRFAAILGLLTH